MFKRIKQTFITLGLASGMTAVALFYFHNVNTCRDVVLMDLAKHQRFMLDLDNYSQSQDFLTALTKGK